MSIDRSTVFSSDSLARMIRRGRVTFAKSPALSLPGQRDVVFGQLVDNLRSLLVEPHGSTRPDADLVVIADTGQRVTLRVVPPETDGASASQAMTAATYRSVKPPTGDPVTPEAIAVETASLDELAARLARLPGNTDPKRAALISRWVGEAAEQFSNAPIQAFVPILAEHILRGRLYNTRADRHARSMH